MTMPKQDDDEIDALVCQASTRPVDEARLAQVVLGRVREEPRPGVNQWANLFAFPNLTVPGRLATAGFAVVLVATPFLVAGYSGEAVEDALYAFAVGDPALMFSTEQSLTQTGILE
jgi:hypothetical protein